MIEEVVSANRSLGCRKKNIPKKVLSTVSRGQGSPRLAEAILEVSRSVFKAAIPLLVVFLGG
jgi:hypothetical protein